MAKRVISGNYGHEGNASGKMYDYETDKDYRTGDVVVVPVTHAKSGKMYNTLFTVRMTYSMDTEAGKKKIDYLTDPKNKINPKNVSQRLDVALAQGLDVKFDGDVTVRTLPGYSTMQENIKAGVPGVTRQNWSGRDNSAEATIARNSKRVISRTDSRNGGAA